MIIGKGSVDTDNKNVRLKRVGPKRREKEDVPSPDISGQRGALDKGLNARSFQTLYLYTVSFHLGLWPKTFFRKKPISNKNEPRNSSRPQISTFVGSCHTLENKQIIYCGFSTYFLHDRDPSINYFTYSEFFFEKDKKYTPLMIQCTYSVH